MQQRTLLFVTVVLLLSIGVVMIYSTSAFFAQDKFNDSYYFLKRQALWIMCGLVAFACAVNIDYHNLRTHSLSLLFTSMRSSSWSTCLGWGGRPAEQADGSGVAASVFSLPR